MSSLDKEIDSKKSTAQQAEEIKQMAESTAEETSQTIESIQTEVNQSSGNVRNINDLKELEVQLQVCYYFHCFKAQIVHLFYAIMYT